MAAISSYSHFTLGSVHAEAWDEAWYTIQSWKGYLQSFPGLISFHMAARPLDNGDVRFQVVTTWEYPEQLEEWQGSRWSAEKLLAVLRQPAYDVISETYEDLD